MNADQAEAAFWAAFLRNRNVDVASADDGAVAVAGGYALYASGAYQQVALAVGSSRPLDEDDLAVLAAFYGERGRPVRIEVREQALERDRPLLERARFAFGDGALRFFERPVDGRSEAPDVLVRRTSDHSEWLRIVTTAFADGETADEESRRSLELSASASAALFVAEVDGVAAGGAALGVAGEFAFLYCGGVLPRFRRRGVHRALVLARVAEARARGIARAMVKVADGSLAERTVRGAGFEPTLTVRRLTRE
jgi:ribosomal protein S18 acetylase RimI-like enzyme